MRSASGLAKLPIANVGRFRDPIRSPGVSACSPLKTPRKQIYSSQLRHFKEDRLRHAATLTKTGASRISRAIVRDGPVLPGGGSFGAVNGPFWAGQHHRTYLNSAAKLQRQNCPVSGESTREADLSTQQTGAQAPSRLPRPSCHDRRPQGSRRAPCAWPQASERLTRASPEIPL